MQRIWTATEKKTEFFVYCCNTVSSSEERKSTFNEMAKFVEIVEIFAVFSHLSWRMDRHHSFASSLENDCVCIIASVCRKIFCLESFN